MTAFDFIANGTLHQIELPYLVNVETARQWLQTLDHPSPERKAAVEAKHKAESEAQWKLALQESDRKRLAAYEKAEKLADFDGAVYDDNSERWFDDIGALLEHYDDEGEEPPAWVWASKPQPFGVPQFEDVFSRLDDHYEGCMERVESAHPEAVAELNDALERFVETIQHLSGFAVDYSRVVLIKRS